MLCMARACRHTYHQLLVNVWPYLLHHTRSLGFIFAWLVLTCMAHACCHHGHTWVSVSSLKGRSGSILCPPSTLPSFLAAQA